MDNESGQWEEDPRFKQCNREFVMILLLFVFNVVIVTGGSALLGHGVSGESMTMIFGLPEWFFWGGLVTSIVFCLVSILLVIFFFKDMSLESENQEEVEK